LNFWSHSCNFTFYNFTPLKSRSQKCEIIQILLYFWKILVKTNSTVYINAAPIEVKGQNEVPKFFWRVKPRLLDTPSDSTPSTYISLHSARRAEFIDTSHDLWTLIALIYINIYMSLKKYSIPVELLKERNDHKNLKPLNTKLLKIFWAQHKILMISLWF
jgi:hypothetical protein